jgi:hypothetical protein
MSTVHALSPSDHPFYCATATPNAGCVAIVRGVRYGEEGSGLELSLVYNPVGAFLPPPQEALEAAYKVRRLGSDAMHGFLVSGLRLRALACTLWTCG